MLFKEASITGEFLACKLGFSQEKPFFYSASFSGFLQFEEHLYVRMAAFHVPVFAQKVFKDLSGVIAGLLLW